MTKYRIIAEQSDELTALFNRADATLAVVEGDECWLRDDIDASQFPELRECADERMEKLIALVIAMLGDMI